MEEQIMIWEERLAELKQVKPTGDLMLDMEIQDEIFELETKLGIREVTCSLDGGECLSCGS